MKSIIASLLLLPAFWLTAQPDDHCTCMDPPNYFDDSMLDFINHLNVELERRYPTTPEPPRPVLVTDNYLDESMPENPLLELPTDKPVNISPSDLSNISSSEAGNTSSPEASDGSPSKEKATPSPSKVRKTVIKKRKKRIKRKVKRRKKARKYRGECPGSF